MELTEVFGEIAKRTIYTQRLEQCMKHAAPLIAVLDKIQAFMPESEDSMFSYRANVFPQSIDQGQGSMTTAIGLYDKESKRALLTTGERPEWHDNHSPRKLIYVSIDTDGKAEISRLDHATPKKDKSGEMESPRVKADSVTELLPILASWLEDNIPEAAQNLKHTSVNGFTPQSLYRDTFDANEVLPPPRGITVCI